ncbi:MAG TPA: pyridoxal-dependent decarboxylase [Hyalangium sp.]|nr:pyridoxal-dependent decarboxylase [Hyalangium sp.]
MEDASLGAAERFLAVASHYIASAGEGRGPVSTALTPSQLAARFDEPLPLTGRPLGDVIARLERDVIGDATRLMHPMYMGHQVSAPIPAAIWTEPVIAALNQSMTVWEMSPTATVIERQVVRWMCGLLGLGASSGGTFTSGGTEATFTALLAARAAALPDAWQEGIGEDAPVVLYGEQAHYGVTRAVAELGLGMRRAIAIPTKGFRMDVDALAKRLKELGRGGTRVMAVVATAGSTATGHFDDLSAIAELCRVHRTWLHVDGAHGASALLSPAHRHRLRGIEHADSVAWDAHKMMLLPLTSGMLLVRHEPTLEAAFAQRAPYLFHQVAGEPSWDQGKRTFMCARRADALKLWVTLQRHGAAALGALYEQLCSVTRELHAAISARTDFEALHEPESNILCFRFVGDRSRAHDAHTLDELNSELRAQYNRSGHGWITTTLVGGRRVLRAVVMNPRTTVEHARALVARLGELAYG